MRNEEAQLQTLRKKMSPEQRKQMADLLASELRKRQTTKKPTAQSDLSRDDLREIYQTSEQKLKGRVGNGLKKRQPLATVPAFLGALKPRNVAIIFIILVLASIKIVLSTGLVDASTSSASTDIAPIAPAPINAAPVPSPVTPEATSSHWSESEKDLLSQLDLRRVELEKRKELLEAREADLGAKEQALSEQLVELRSLQRKLDELRREKDQIKESRLEQLATVYGSMDPQEAAPLIGKLDNEIALSLLQRMPTKRMGQILGMMESERAVALTKSLTDKKGQE